MSLACQAELQNIMDCGFAKEMDLFWAIRLIV